MRRVGVGLLDTARAGAWGWRAGRHVGRAVRADGLAGLDRLPAPPRCATAVDRSAVAAGLRLAGANCLERSAVLQRWDAGRGLARPLLIGVAPDGSEGISAHAWLEGEPGADGYTVLHRRPPPEGPARLPFGRPTAPEVWLVLAAARADRPDLAPLLAQELDWRLVVRLAHRHQVLSLLGRRVEDSAGPDIPEAVATELRRYRQALAARNLLLARRLLDVTACLGDAGIDCVPYKGPLLALSAYGDLAARPFADLDVLLSAEDAERARAVLQTQGYRSLTPGTDVARLRRRPQEYAFPLASPDGRAAVELHWRIAPRFSLSAAEVQAACRPATLLGVTVPDLSPEHSVLVQSVHGTKHGWNRLEWIAALAHFIARTPDLDWDVVLAEAAARSARRAVALGVRLAADTGGAPVPAEVLAEASRAKVGRLAAAIEVGLESVETIDARGSARNRMIRLWAMAPAARIAHVASLARPSEKDLAAFALPGKLAFLYYVVRPVRVGRDLWHAAEPIRRWKERALRRRAGRARDRQLVHQKAKAVALAGQETEVLEKVTGRWDAVHARLAALRPLPADARVLEVGSGAHGLVFGYGGPAVGLDPLAHEYASLFPAWQRRVPTVAGEGERLPFPSAVFDLVVCDNVVDHAEAPKAIVAELVRVLVPGGVCLFTVNVHHPFWRAAAGVHRALAGAGITLDVAPFADHTVHLTLAQGDGLFHDLPVRVLHEEVGVAEARRRARRRRRHVGDLVAMLFYKNARLVIVAQRRG